MRGVLLVLNTGSSSIKFALHDADTRARIAHGAIEGVGRAPCLTLHTAGTSHSLHPDQGPQSDTAALIDWPLGELAAQLGPMEVVAAGHRVVRQKPGATA